MDPKPKKFYWHANTSNGGTLSMSVNFDEGFSEEEKKGVLAASLRDAYQFMDRKGYIPTSARLMSSRDIAEKHGKSRQYWEKLLNEGKILYKETAAGRITTDLWVKGYLGNKEEVDQYVRDVRTVLRLTRESKKRSGKVQCPVCNERWFEFARNYGGNINGICRACGFHVHTRDEDEES